ncbi:MAG: tyrosine-type recombinase/integrase [Deltaproteobacteria bacterium]|nr:tyrosine-type recombinase/integrase [Deltaproteobacteria bacterium]
MNQGSEFVTQQEPTPAFQDQGSRIIPPKKVLRRFVHTKIPKLTVSLPLSLIPQKPEKKPIDYVLTRLASMDLPGKVHVEDYLRHQYRRNFKLNTMRSTLAGCELFLSFLKDQGKTELKQINRQDLEGFVEQEIDRGLAITTVKTRLCAVYAFLRFLHERDIVRAALLVKRIKLRLPAPLPKAINPDDIRTLLSVLDDVRDRAMILVLLRTGMRIGELLSTRIDDVNLPERKIAIWEAEKNSVGRVVCISDDAAIALEAWFRKRDPDKVFLFYGMGRSSLTYQGARALFVRYIKKAGLTHKGYTLHCLRHTFASEALNAGMPLEAVQVLLGHSNAEVTRRYARLTDKTREREYFKAMEIIQRGEIDGDYRLDS